MSLRLNVAQLLKSSPGTTRAYHIEEEAREVTEELAATGPLRGEVEFMRTADGVLVRGNFQVSAELLCDRCLELFVVPLHFPVDEEYHPTADIYTGAALEVDADREKETLIDAFHIIDLTEVLRQDVLLAVPVHPLCRSDCAGLCPECGQNLNQGACNCESTTVDPRLAGLALLLGDQKTLKKGIGG